MEPLFKAIPLATAMTKLVVTASVRSEVAASIARDPIIAARPPLLAGLWLYVDDLDQSHTISQSIDDTTGSYWHAIMHRREGDFSNSHYWLRQTGNHPAMALIDDYDAHRFIDEVAAAHRKGEAPAQLVSRQRREWMALFQWCAAQ